MKRSMVVLLVTLFSLTLFKAWGADINDVTFFTKVKAYEALTDTTIVTQEGKRLPVTKGTRLNVAGFTKTEAFVISRKDRPNGFVRKADIAPAK